MAAATQITANSDVPVAGPSLRLRSLIKMDDELLLLQQQFLAAQQVQSATCLSERNVVELVTKLRQRGLLGDDLLHSLNGKEYITEERLRREMASEVARRGRIALVDLATVLNVDLFYCERGAKAMLEDAAAGHGDDDHPKVQLVQGELVTSAYWDGVADEVDASLQECGQLALADLAMRFNVGAELIATVLTERLGTRIRGKMGGGQLYTAAHVDSRRPC